jgi:hypothetical protein
MYWRHSRVIDQDVDALGPQDDGLDSNLNGSVVANIHLDKLDTG